MQESVYTDDVPSGEGDAEDAVQAVPEHGRVGGGVAQYTRIEPVRAFITPMMVEGELHDHGRMLTFVSEDGTAGVPFTDVPMGEYLLVRVSDTIDWHLVARLQREGAEDEGG